MAIPDTLYRTPSRLESKGHPLGATGLGNVFYLAMQLRGWAGPMQAPEVAPKMDDRKKDNEASGAGSSVSASSRLIIEDPHAMLHNLGLGECNHTHLTLAEISVAAVLSVITDTDVRIDSSASE